MKSSAIVLIALGLAASPLSAQEIYRVVDENGNVTYTDQKPDDNSEPVDLPELNVLEGKLGGELESEFSEQAGEQGGENPADEAEREPMNFRIEQPADGSTQTVEGDMLEIVMGIDIDVPPTARITLVLDGEPLTPVRSLETSIPAPAPGEHRLFARLETPSGRSLGTTDPVSFTTVAAGDD